MAQEFNQLMSNYGFADVAAICLAGLFPKELDESPIDKKKGEVA